MTSSMGCFQRRDRTHVSYYLLHWQVGSLSLVSLRSLFDWVLLVKSNFKRPQLVAVVSELFSSNALFKIEFQQPDM